MFLFCFCFFFKQKTAYEMRISDWSSDVCSSDLLIDWLHEANARGAKAVILNPGGYTHTSVALHDAIKSINVPVIEVHLSNPHARESFRHKSFVGQAAKGTIAGFGAFGYLLALDAATRI